MMMMMMMLVMVTMMMMMMMMVLLMMMMMMMMMLVMVMMMMMMMMKMVMMHKRCMESLVAGKNIHVFARSSTGFCDDNFLPNLTTHETHEIKDCSSNAVDLRDSNNTETLKMLFYTTAAYGRWT